MWAAAIFWASLAAALAIMARARPRLCPRTTGGLAALIAADALVPGLLYYVLQLDHAIARSVLAVAAIAALAALLLAYTVAALLLCGWRPRALERRTCQRSAGAAPAARAPPSRPACSCPRPSP